MFPFSSWRTGGLQKLNICSRRCLAGAGTLSSPWVCRPHSSQLPSASVLPSGTLLWLGSGKGNKMSPGFGHQRVIGDFGRGAAVGR